MRRIERLAIANRGEVAVRIIRACQEMGIETVLLHSEADVRTRAWRMADKTICIGPAPSSESYLNIEANIRGAIAGGAQAVHPGFGFLSENADFAQACADAGLIFVGPSPDSIRRLGDKVQCKELAQQAGLPLIPGYQGEDQTIKNLVQQALKIGLPVIVKAAAGGGGRGMKLIRSEAEASELIESAQREAQSAFGSPKVFLEKYLDRAKHIEFQIFGDASGKVVHLFDRECSVQRRHQKIIEEALSPSLDPELRRRMGEAAVAIAELGRYKGAGTVEFLLQDRQFYLLEVNTRLQVEHPVTEEVLGVDLVKAQILTAMGEYLHSPADVRVPRGHAIECRIYAENPYLGGVPSTGLLGRVEWPEGPGRRFEFGFEKGDTITSFYDPMIAKVITWDETRIRCIQKMIRVLKDTVIFGVHSNIPYLLEILQHPEFIEGRMTTRFIEQHFANPISRPQETEFHERLFAEALKVSSSSKVIPGARKDPSPWEGAWRLF
ncbi:MAG: ATP-grasp domain-containing protein [Bdellovibrionaceae bacterium]|nr:ATP-grasp domain-containing protein [Pseudobdellovibrionaceae bacterium]